MIYSCAGIKDVKYYTEQQATNLPTIKIYAGAGACTSMRISFKGRRHDAGTSGSNRLCTTNSTHTLGMKYRVEER